MNVSLKNMDAGSVLLKIEVEKKDYKEQCDKSLRKLRQKATIPGFRQGMVPFGMIRKMYWKQTLAEELNKLVSDQLYSYLQENQIKVIGEPLPNETEQKELDFDTDESFEFCFDVALAPEVDFQLAKEDQLTSYRILVDDDMVNKQIELYRKNFDSQDDDDKEEENEKKTGVKEEEEKEAETKETEEEKKKEPELNQEFFDRIFGTDTVKNETEFRDKIKELLMQQFSSQTGYKLRNDVHDLLISKMDGITFADDILKRWFLLSNKKMSEESIEEDFPKIKNELKYQLVKEKIAKDLEVQVSKNEIEAMAKSFALSQFAQYGAFSGLDDIIDNYVSEMMKKEETVNNLADRILDEKVINGVKGMITINEQEVTFDEFTEILKGKI